MKIRQVLQPALDAVGDLRLHVLGCRAGHWAETTMVLRVKPGSSARPSFR